MSDSPTLNLEHYNITRRGLFRGLAGIGVGTIVGSTLVPPVGGAVDEFVAETTGRMTGNASFREEMVERCVDETDPEGCFNNFQPSEQDKFQAIIAAPIMEEPVFRGLSSVLVDFADDDLENIVRNLAVGTGTVGFTRAEMIGGVVSSLVFGVAHNLTKNGLDTRTVPASVTFAGLVNWCLTRKFGLGAGILGHAASNYTVFKNWEQ